MTGTELAAEAQASRSKADWASYQALLRKNSTAPADVEALHALATKLGRADSLASDYEAVRQFDLAKSKVSAGLLATMDSAKHAAAIHREETTQQALADLRAKHAAEVKELASAHDAQQAKLAEAIFHAHNAYKAGVDGVNKINSLLQANPKLLADQQPLSVSVLK
jgi:hypothetical protein